MVAIAGACVCTSVLQNREGEFFSRRGLAKSRISRLGSSDLPRASSTMMATTMEAKLLSNFTCKKDQSQYQEVTDVIFGLFLLFSSF